MFTSEVVNRKKIFMPKLSILSFPSTGRYEKARNEVTTITNGVRPQRNPLERPSLTTLPASTPSIL